jgi:hypothetical protein
VIALLIAAVIVYGEGLPTGSRQWVVLAISMILGATGGLLAGFLISVLFIALSSRKSNGVLGEHIYTLQDDGLHERTDVNESLAKWAGITDIRRTRSFIFVQIAPWLYHIFPRRDFENPAAYDQFWVAISNFARRGA